MEQIDEPRKRLLYVDDRFDRALIEAVAQQEKITIMLEKSPFAALEELYEMHYGFYDAVILDLSMPKKSGRQLTEEIRENEKMFKRDEPLKLFWYTSWSFDMNDPDDPWKQTFEECNVTKLFIKGDTEPGQMIREIKEILQSNNAEKKSFQQSQS